MSSYTPETKIGWAAICERFLLLDPTKLILHCGEGELDEYISWLWGRASILRLVTDKELVDQWIQLVMVIHIYISWKNSEIHTVYLLIYDQSFNGSQKRYLQSRFKILTAGCYQANTFLVLGNCLQHPMIYTFFEWKRVLISIFQQKAFIVDNGFA